MKERKMFNYSIRWLIVGILSSLFAHLILETIARKSGLLITLYDFSYNKSMLFYLGTAIIFVLYTLFSSLLGSSVLGSILIISISTMAGIATNLKINFRGEPIYPNEVYWLREVRFLFDIIGKGNTILVLSLLTLTILSLFLLNKYVLKPVKDPSIARKKTIARIIGVVLSFGLLFYIGRFNYQDNLISKIYGEYAGWASWNQQKNYRENGFVAGFLSNLDSPPMEMPENYSKDTIEKIFNKYKDYAHETQQNNNDKKLETNIIFVMNESFSDPFNLEGVHSNKDPIPYFRELQEDTLNGTLLAPGFGGGTATNEFQVLTGISLEPLSQNITSPFIQMIHRMNRFPSLPNKMKEYGYRATAIHAFAPTYYRRREVYQDLGFDEFIHRDTMMYRDKPDISHPYISDHSIYQEMFDVMEDTEEIDFLHLVTMQNHAEYRDKYEKYDFEVLGTGDDESAKGYFQDLSMSDEALKSLITELENYPEPVLLVFWGDHLPGFYQEDIISQNSNQMMYETPFFIYSNEVELKEDIGLRSLIYVNNYLNKILHLEASPFEVLLLQLEEKLPVLDKRVYYDTVRSKKLYSRNVLSIESKELLRDYSMIMYDITTGNNYANEIGFFDYTN